MSVKELAYISTPPPTGKPVKSLGDFISASGDWHAKTARKNRGMLSDLWTRLGSVLPSLQGGRPAVETVTEPVDEARALVCITLILLPEADEVAIV